MNPNRSLQNIRLGRSPFAVIAITTLAVVAISIYCLSSGYFIIFQNLFYIPIIIACVYYTKRGFAFSVIIACIYFLLTLVFTRESSTLLQAFIRVLIFVLVAGIIAYLSSARKRVEEALSISEGRYRRLFESAKDGILILDSETGAIVDVNPFLIEKLGYSHEQFMGKRIWELGPVTDIMPNRDGFLELQRQGYIRYENLPLETIDGRHVDVEFVSNVYLVDGKKVIQCNIRDITERKRVELQVRERMKELQAFYSLARITEREGITLDQLYEEVTNILPKSWLYPEIACARIAIGASEFRTTNFVDSAWKQSAPVKVNGAVVGRVEVGYLEERPEEGEGPFLKEERLLIDAIAERLGHITESKRAQKRLEYIGSHDVLSGLYNRAYFEEEFARLERGRSFFPVSVVMADVDGMKAVNDTQGHEAGDALLQRAATVLIAAFRTEDVVSRIGGDEFAVMLPGADRSTAEKALARVREILAIHNNNTQGSPLNLSIGAATGEEGCKLAEVMREADNRMYQEKQAKKAGTRKTSA